MIFLDIIINSRFLTVRFLHALQKRDEPSWLIPVTPQFSVKFWKIYCCNFSGLFNNVHRRSLSCAMTDFSLQCYISNRFITFSNLVLTIPSMEPIFSRTNLSISLNVAL